MSKLQSKHVVKERPEITAARITAKHGLVVALITAMAGIIVAIIATKPGPKDDISKPGTETNPHISSPPPIFTRNDNTFSSHLDNGSSSAANNSTIASTSTVRALAIEEHSFSVPANEYWYDTDLQVRRGDQLDFVAKGRWWNGISQTGPEGDSGLIWNIGRPGCGQCPVVDGNLGELVAKINGTPAFRIGLSTTVHVSSDGKLMLAMNENTGPCKAGQQGSCYEDNQGALEVKVIRKGSVKY